MKPGAEAETPKTALDLDRRFDAGSGIVLTELSRTQVANLTTFGKVWGFLKYHHAAVTSGKFHWDYELLNVLPTILEQRDTGAANAAMAKWISGMGPIDPSDPCASLNDSDLHLRPDTGWMEEEALLGSELRSSLRAIYTDRPHRTTQFYVSLERDIHNPCFEHELDYEQLTFPDAGYQLLALYRFWNIVQYWFPYRDMIGEDWHSVLSEFVPRIALAKDKQAYKLELMALIARVHDTHANLWSGFDARPPTGQCQIPAIIRFIEGRAVVTGFSSPEAERICGLRIGDIILSLDGAPVATLVEPWTPYYAASNDAACMRDIAYFLTRGAFGNASVRIIRDGKALTLNTSRTKVPQAHVTHDLPGDTFRPLSPEVAYLKLSSVKESDAVRYVESARGTKGLVIDIRNYPSEFVVFALGALLVDQETPFVRFTRADPSTPGAFHWTPPLSLTPQAPRYEGKLAILVDEVSQSQAEYTAMAFRSAPNAIVIGSTTGGADGDVSPVPLPGAQQSMISGLGVFYPDGKPTQRVGIIPDIEARPTIAGIRSGRDEVLETALRHILGPGVSEEEIEKMARPARGAGGAGCSEINTGN
jgi:C-terminal processing protease CtpA/Prc